jgi:hypothetical protein
MAQSVKRLGYSTGDPGIGNLFPGKARDSSTLHSGVINWWYAYLQGHSERRLGDK